MLWLILSELERKIGRVYNNFMRASPGKQYSIGDIINNLINKRLTPLADRQKSWSQRRRSSLSNQHRIAKEHSLFNPPLEPINNIKEKMGIFTQDFGNWLHSSKESSSRLLQAKQTSQQERKSSRESDNPEKYTSKDKLRNAFIARKKSSGQLQNLLEKTDTKEPNMFRETFRTLKPQPQSLAIKASSTASQFYLTTMSKQTIPFSSTQKPLHFPTRKRSSHLYRTFYA